MLADHPPSHLGRQNSHITPRLASQTSNKASFQVPGAPNQGKPLVSRAEKPSPNPGQTDCPIPTLREAKVEAFREAEISETAWERSPDATPKGPDARTDGRTDARTHQIQKLE